MGTSPVVIPAMLVVAVCFGATATATAAAATTAIAAAATTATTVAIIATAPALLPGDAIDRVVKLAARDRAVRRRLALEHAHEPHVAQPFAGDIHQLEQPREAVAGHADLGADRLG